MLVLYPDPTNKYPYTDRSWQTSNRRRWSWLCHSWWRPQSNGARQEIHGQTLRGALLTLRARKRSHTEPTARLNHTTGDKNVPWQPYEQKLQLSATASAAANVAKPVHKLWVVRWFKLGRQASATTNAAEGTTSIATDAFSCWHRFNLLNEYQWASNGRDGTEDVCFGLYSFPG